MNYYKTCPHGSLIKVEAKIHAGPRDGSMKTFCGKPALYWATLRDDDERDVTCPKCLEALEMVEAGLTQQTNQSLQER